MASCLTDRGRAQVASLHDHQAKCAIKLIFEVVTMCDSRMRRLGMRSYRHYCRGRVKRGVYARDISRVLKLLNPCYGCEKGGITTSTDCQWSVCWAEVAQAGAPLCNLHPRPQSEQTRTEGPLHSRQHSRSCLFDPVVNSLRQQRQAQPARTCHYPGYGDTGGRTRRPAPAKGSTSSSNWNYLREPFHR